MVFVQTEIHKDTCTWSKEGVKMKTRAGCALDVSSVGVALFFKNTHEIPSEVTGSAPVHLPRAKLGPLYLAFLRNPRLCNMFIFLSLFLAAKQVKNFISSN